MDALDLFGEPIIRRSAYFPRPGVRRRLSRSWGQGKSAFVLGCNPSDAGGDREDNTSRWWNRWFEHWGFARYDAGNLSPFVTPSPSENKARVERALNGEWGDRDELFANRDDVVRMAKAADQVFVCFGNIAWDSDWTESVLEEIQSGEAPWPDLWCWGKTKSGAPIHPMARGKHRIDPLTPAVLWRSAA
ncbi:DUF1643 domain-containing protein [Qipengyuania sp. MTN3-11]|uniref:DUF1643 domain-containing protein n=1 Tax=Qipengyuania sp. MTN3-11 TaxID=3056557 RepID=UPI0036F2BA5D